MRVTFFQRRPQSSNYSIEGLFADVRAALPASIDAKVAVSHYPSRGFWRRLYNIIEAAFRQGDVNHITGDVHFLAYLLHGKRTLLTITDLVMIHRLSGLRKMALFFFWYWLPIKRSALISVISESTKEDLLGHVKIDEQKIQVVHCCVSSLFKPDPIEFNATKPRILQIGTGQNKNLERVAEALVNIPCHFRVIGLLDADMKAFLKKCNVEYSSTTGISQEEVINEYRCCDMVVFASTYEGFGLPIVEAQATGRPVVTSNVMSMPEVAGNAACLVDPFDVASIRGGILKLIKDSAYRNELVRRGFENVERFRPEKIAAQYADIYRILMKR